MLIYRQSSFSSTCTYILLIFLLSISGTAYAQTEEPKSSYAFVDVNVVPMDSERILERQTVLIRGDRIMEIGPAGSVDLPEDIEQIGGEGRYLMPGLAEMHAHVPGPDNPEYLRNILFLYLSNGVTTIRNMAGHPFHLELREQIQQEEVLGPNFYTSSPWLAENQISSPDEAPPMVKKFYEAGFDLLKLGSISPEAYEEMVAAANDIDMPFGGHIPEGVGLERALEAGQVSIDHYDRYVEFLAAEAVDLEETDSGFFGSGVVMKADTGRIPLAVELTLDAGTWNVPTLSLVEHLAAPESPEEMISREEMQYMPQDIRDDWVQAKKDFQQREDFQPESARRLVEIRRQLTKALYEAGAPIALGSDAPQFFNVPGFSIHHEMQMMVDAGLTPYEVLETGTRNAAEYFNRSEETGTVETGRQADLILLEANPLEDIANVQQRAGVMVAGKWLPIEEIQQGLQEISASYE